MNTLLIPGIRHLGLCLVEPEARIYRAVHSRRRSEMLAGTLCLANVAVQPAQAQMAVRDERTRTLPLGDQQRLPIMGCPAFGVEPVGMGRDVAEQPRRMSRKAGPVARRFDRAIGQSLRVVEPTEQQTGATGRVVAPAVIDDQSPRRLALEELLGLPDAARRLARLAGLRQ